MSKTIEPQYNIFLETANKHGIARLGVSVNHAWHEDPKHVLFTLARYKFVAKMLAGKHNVLEVGCGDAFGTRLVQQTSKHVTAVDLDPLIVKDVEDRAVPAWPLKCFVHNILDGPVEGEFDGIYSLDVLEHIDPALELKFVRNLLSSLRVNGTLILGTPSKQSQNFASQQSGAGHVNCKTGEQLRELLEEYFHNVLMFSMNDELIHTGFMSMANYLFAVSCNSRN